MSGLAFLSGGENIDLTEPPNTFPPAIISDYTLPEPAVEAITAPSVEVARESGFVGEDKEIGCSCVPFARKTSGINFPVVAEAKNLEPNADEPSPGGVVIFKDVFPYGTYGHLAVVTEVSDDSFKIVEKNLKPCEVSTRTIKREDSAIKGFYNG